jgi:GT2 family glycosyltransferase
VVDSGALVELLKRAEQPRLGIVGSTLRFYHEPDTLHGLAGGALDRRNATTWHIGEHLPVSTVPSDGADVERQLAYVCGASMLVSRSYIREIGLMEEDYFLYYEDADWSMRGAGLFRLGFAPRSHVFHKSGANSSKVVAEITAHYYYRNRLRFVRRFLPDRMAAAKRRMFMELLRHVARRRWVLARAAGRTLLSPPLN